MKKAFEIAGKVALYVVSAIFFVAAGVNFYTGDYVGAFASVALSVLFFPFVALAVTEWMFDAGKRPAPVVARALPAIAEPALVRNAPKPKPEPKKKPRPRTKTTKTKRK